MLERSIDDFSLTDCLDHLFGELIAPIDHADHIRADIFIHKLFDDSLCLPLGLRFFDDDIGFYYLIKHVRLGLVEDFNLIGLHVVKIEFFGDDVIINLQSEIAVESFLFLVLDGSVHDLLRLEVLF